MVIVPEAGLAAYTEAVTAMPLGLDICEVGTRDRLARFPVDGVKIDRSFITNTATSETDRQSPPPSSTSATTSERRMSPSAAEVSEAVA